MAVTCRVVGVSRSGFYDWLGRDAPARSVMDAHLNRISIGHGEHPSSQPSGLPPQVSRKPASDRTLKSLEN